MFLLVLLLVDSHSQSLKLVFVFLGFSSKQGSTVLSFTALQFLLCLFHSVYVCDTELLCSVSEQVEKYFANTVVEFYNKRS